jgi:hypothetical protein
MQEAFHGPDAGPALRKTLFFSRLHERPLDFQAEPGNSGFPKVPSTVDVEHLQTNGRIERFFGEVERRINKFRSVGEIGVWHNEVKPHSSLNYDEPFMCKHNSGYQRSRSSEKNYK